VENRVQLVHENGATSLLQPVDCRTAIGLPQNGGNNRRSESSIDNYLQHGSMRVNASHAGLVFDKATIFTFSRLS
jgi:hypothetical protein